MVEIKEKSKIIRFVPDLDRYIILIAAAAMMLVWFGVVNMAVDTSVPSGMKNSFGPLADLENTSFALILGAIGLGLAIALWSFSLRNPTAFALSRQGITVHALMGMRTVTWNEVTMMERRIGKLVLHTTEDRSGWLEKPEIVFNTASLSMSSTEIESLVTYHRPDLLTTISHPRKEALRQAADTGSEKTGTPTGAREPARA